MGVKGHVFIVLSFFSISASGMPTLSLKYLSSEAMCPTELEFRGLVSARLGYEPFLEDASVVATVEISKTSRGLQGVVEISGAQRRVQSAGNDCKGLSQTLALTLAMAVDPQLFSKTTPVREEEKILRKNKLTNSS